MFVCIWINISLDLFLENFLKSKGKVSKVLISL